MQTLYGSRERCYKCYRPKSSCMCKEVNTLYTKTKFIILMHPKEFKKVKNGTGHLTHLSLKNSQLFIGVDFSHHKEINEIIAIHDSYLLYPSKEALNISREKPKNSSRDMAIFIIDSTWSCSLKVLRDSSNLREMKHISFDSDKLSEFKIKQQPEDYCLSTIESTLCVLESLNKHGLEELEKKDLDQFLTPFYSMIDYQIKCIANPRSNAVRYKRR